MNQIELAYGSRIIPVSVVLSKRKSVSIIVRPDTQVIIRAPLKTTQKVIHNALTKHLKWITKKLNYFAQFQGFTSNHNFVSGETHYFLGESYQLQIKNNLKANVQIIEKNILAELPIANGQKSVSTLLLNWYEKQAKEILNLRMMLYLPEFLKLGIKPIRIKYRRMKSRWGSCSSKGVITLNINLIKVSLDCIDYVIAHELCHLINLSHNVKFYKLLERFVPDYKMRRKKLKTMSLIAM